MDGRRDTHSRGTIPEPSCLQVSVPPWPIFPGIPRLCTRPLSRTTKGIFQKRKRRNRRKPSAHTPGCRAQHHVAPRLIEFNNDTIIRRSRSAQKYCNYLFLLRFFWSDTQ